MAARRPPARVSTIRDLTADPKNARTHSARNLSAIETSLRKVGGARSIVIDEDNVILAGNGTVLAAAAVGIDKVRVVEATGDEIIAVRRTGLSKRQKAELAVYDNRTAELADWDEDALRALAADEGLDLIDLFSDRELEKLQIVAAPPAGHTNPDAVPDERRTSVARGQLFALGHHRLLCGDSTNPSDVASVVGSDRPALMNTDPPYGVDLSEVKPKGVGFNTIEREGGIANDDLTDGPALQAFLERVIRAAVPVLSEAPAFYLWHPMLTQGTFFAAAAAADILIHRQIIWVKPHMVLTRSGQYHWRHELAFYGWIKGKPCAWLGDKAQTSVWEFGESTHGRMHPTQKPVELFVRPMRNHTKEGDAVYEPFSGAGSQIIAAEQTRRRCLAVEIAPKYVQVAIDRWEAFTGLKAKKIGEVAPA